MPNEKIAIPALLGEIFQEEGREFSARYEGVIRAVASGKNTLTEITNFLYSNRLIEKEDSSQIKPYLTNLIKMGLITRIKEYKVTRFRYFVSSPLIDIYYYLDEKYNFSEQDLSRKYFEEKIPKHVEMFIRNLLAKIFGKGVAMYQKADREVDILLLDFNRIFLVGEVKWKKNITRKDVKKAEKNLEHFRAKKVLIVPDKTTLEYYPENLEVWDVSDLIEKCGGRDLNPRTPTGRDPKSRAFDRARQPPLVFPQYSYVYKGSG